VRGNDLIAVEDLAVADMVRNRKLARAISDCGRGEFRRQPEYKCERYGRELVVTGRWHPSSKTCPACGHLLAELSLATRHWTCPSCGTRHDRDVNAAKNILAAGRAVARGSPGDACGADVRHSGSSRVRSAVKQELRSARARNPRRSRRGVVKSLTSPPRRLSMLSANGRYSPAGSCHAYKARAGWALARVSTLRHRHAPDIEDSRAQLAIVSRGVYQVASGGIANVVSSTSSAVNASTSHRSHAST
jgi:hypothetical protein